MNSFRQNIRKPIISYFRCHPWTGDCACAAGWDGPTCSRTCPLYMYGEGCRRKCDCKNNAQCVSSNGTCICGPGKSNHLYVKCQSSVVLTYI